jgi:hypothetical protein
MKQYKLTTTKKQRKEKRVLFRKQQSLRLRLRLRLR